MVIMIRTGRTAAVARGMVIMIRTGRMAAVAAGW
jgi:hypothetical protein